VAELIELTVGGVTVGRVDRVDRVGGVGQVASRVGQWLNCSSPAYF